MPSISKNTAEEVIMHRFIDAYKEKTGKTISHVKKTNPPKPDFTAMLEEGTNNRIGFEVTGVYQNEEEAKIQYWRQEGWEDMFVGDQEKIVEEFNRILEKKAKKSFKYDFDGELILVIHLGSLILNDKIAIQFMEPHLVLTANRFKEVWVLIKDEGDVDDIYQLSNE